MSERGMSEQRAPDRETSYGAPRGTYDKLPPKSRRWDAVMRLALDMFADAGYELVIMPTFEHTEVFLRGVGQESDVVVKQMYTFQDRGDRSLTLRPEGTAGVMRAALEHKLDRGPLPVKLCYAGPMFRQERPQRGRYREFYQVGIEALGAEGPMIDAEVIEIGHRYLDTVGIEPAVLLNSLGHPSSECRQGYLRELTSFLIEHENELAPEDRARIRSNPLRTFDSKEEKTLKVLEDAPLLSGYLCGSCRAHFEAVQQHLDDVGVPFTLDPRLVRGLDYYTRTAWEYVSGGLRSQNAVGGGGRYDGMAEVLGGDHLPGIGFALGLDRILMVTEGREAPPGRVRVYVVTLGEEAAREGFKLASRLRSRGIGCDLDHSGRAMKGQMKDAARSGARWAVILGSDELGTGEATVRDLDSGHQERVPLADVEGRVSR